jgi:hypothetical protein
MNMANLAADVSVQDSLVGLEKQPSTADGASRSLSTSGVQTLELVALFTVITYRPLSCATRGSVARAFSPQMKIARPPLLTAG